MGESFKGFSSQPMGRGRKTFLSRKSLGERDLWPLDFEDTEEGYLAHGWVMRGTKAEDSVCIITTSPQGQGQGVY